MSDPEDIPGRHVPPRADPLQPDRPGSGQGTTDADSADPARRSAPNPSADPTGRGADERDDAGLRNVREGYGGAPVDDHTDDPSMVPNRPASDAQ